MNYLTNLSGVQRRLGPLHDNLTTRVAQAETQQLSYDQLVNLDQQVQSDFDRMLSDVQILPEDQRPSWLEKIDASKNRWASAVALAKKNKEENEVVETVGTRLDQLTLQLRPLHNRLDEVVAGGDRVEEKVGQLQVWIVCLIGSVCLSVCSTSHTKMLIAQCVGMGLVFLIFSLPNYFCIF